MTNHTAQVLETIFPGVTADDPVARCLVLADGAPVALSPTPAAWHPLTARQKCLVSIADAMVDGPNWYPQVTLGTAIAVLTDDELGRVTQALLL